jgi:hypothetical protein
MVHFKKSTAVFAGANKKSKLRYEIYDAICLHLQHFIVKPLAVLSPLMWEVVFRIDIKQRGQLHCYTC